LYNRKRWTGGVEPTTSAAAFLVALYLLSKGMQL
jgi:hypothetical protein